jgi:hypothetical protein
MVHNQAYKLSLRSNIFEMWASVIKSFFGAGIVKSIQALLGDPVHIHSSWHQSASRLVQQSRYTNAIFHFSGDTITFHPSRAMLSVQPVSSMSRDKIHGTTLQSEWMMLLFIPLMSC